MARSKAQAEALRQLLLAAVAKFAGKEHERDQLAAGQEHLVGVSLVGTIDGKTIAEEFEGRLTVGFDQDRASSTAANAGHLVAWILDRYVEPSKHAKIFDELPTLFGAAGGIPIAAFENDGLIERAEALVKKLRAKTTTTARGNVSLNYTRATSKATA